MTSKPTGIAALREAIEMIGGQAATGRAIGVKQQTVYTILNRPGAQVPAKWCRPIDRATDGRVPVARLRPDLFGPDLGGLLAMARERLIRGSTRNAAGCRIWNGPTTGDAPYGTISINGAKDGAHRWAWRVARGPIPAGLLVCHTCDVPLCVKPAHLFLGTYADNSKDRDSKKRGRGPKFNTTTQVGKLRAETGLRQKEFGAAVGFDGARISSWERGANPPTTAEIYAITSAVTEFMRARGAS